MPSTYELNGMDEEEQNLNPDELDVSTASVFDFIVDASGSMNSWATEMHESLEAARDAISGSKQNDEILIAKNNFNENIESFGYQFAKDMDTQYDPMGGTRLYDAIVGRVDSLEKYIEAIRNNGTIAHGFMIIFSDGMDNESRASLSDARNAISKLNNKEIPVAFMAFGDEAKRIAKDLGISAKNTLDVTRDAHELRRVMNLVSKSAISASKKVSTGTGTNDTFWEV